MSKGSGRHGTDDREGAAPAPAASDGAPHAATLVDAGERVGSQLATGFASAQGADELVALLHVLHVDNNLR